MNGPIRKILRPDDAEPVLDVAESEVHHIGKPEPRLPIWLAAGIIGRHQRWRSTAQLGARAPAIVQSQPVQPDGAEPSGRLARAVLIALVAVPLLVNAVTLLPELTSGAPNLNDDAFQFLMVRDASQVLASGGNVLDFWMPQLELGFPQFLYYQNLPHLFVAGLGQLLPGSADLFTLFNLVRYLLLVGLPLTVYWSMRRMGFSMVAAAVSAAASSLFSGNFRYGLEYDSYIWRGFGMYTQLWGVHLSFIALACTYRVINRGTGYVAAMLALIALVLSHLIYAYMMAITLLVVILVGASRKTIISRLSRLVIVGGVAAVGASYMLVPFLNDLQFASVSPYLQSYKYDSFGAPTILGWLFTGDLLDHDRLPVLTAFLGLGVVAAIVTRSRLSVLALAGFGVWLVLYFGRPTLGPLADLLPLHDGLLMHRFIGEMEIFAVLLIGLGGEWIWKLIHGLSRRRLPAVLGTRLSLPSTLRYRWAAPTLAALLVFLAALGPAINERVGFYAQNSLWLEQTRAALDADSDLRTILATLASRPGGRTYAGLRANWGSQLLVGPSVKVTDILTFNGIPAASPPYQGLSLNADMIWDFRDGDQAMFDLLDVRYAIVPANFTVPVFYHLIQATSKYKLYQIATSGAAEYVAVTERRSARSQSALFQANLAWFRSSAPDARQFIQWDYLTPAGPFQPSNGCPGGGRTDYERDESDAYHLVVECPSAAVLALKVTYHPNWHVTVDGLPVSTFMLSPSFIGLDLPPGRHQIDATYEATPSKLPLLAIGIVVLGLAIVFRRRLDSLPRRLEPIRFALPGRQQPVPPLEPLPAKVDGRAEE